MESNLKNMVIVLLTITLVAAGSVGGVYILTKEPIAKAKSDKTAAAIAQVLPAFDNDPSKEVQTRQIEGQDVAVYEAKMGEKTVGYAVQTFSKNGFGGTISLLVGFNIDGTINKISVLEQKETPGLGDKIEPSKSDFSVQFSGKDPASWQLMVKKDGGDVDAITASTISSRAYTAAVAAAYNVFCEITNKDSATSDASSGATTQEIKGTLTTEKESHQATSAETPNPQKTAPVTQNETQDAATGA
ncbi:MAG: RnfABCDGE type electron transport complex subunit G, partial [Mucinivorans sp.]